MTLVEEPWSVRIPKPLQRRGKARVGLTDRALHKAHLLGRATVIGTTRKYEQRCDAPQCTRSNDASFADRGHRLILSHERSLDQTPPRGLELASAYAIIVAPPRGKLCGQRGAEWVKKSSSALVGL